jgi:glutamine amidotransferase
MLVIVDYGVGNLFSLKSSFSAIGEDAVVTSDKTQILNAEKLILPGVGAFGDAAMKLQNSGLSDVVKEYAKSGKPLMGICLGMQLLFTESHEYGIHKGLDLIGGKVVGMKDRIKGDLKIPHMGWNSLKFTDKENPIFKYINDGDFVYFVHSYYATECEDFVTSTADYGANITASVRRDNVYGCQFHPEKSGDVGLKILKAFCEL